MLTGPTSNKKVFARILFNGLDNLVEMCLFEKVQGNTILRCSMVAEQDIAVNIISSLVITGEIEPTITVHDSDELVKQFTAAGIFVNIPNTTIN